ncbi:hypothetical protein [Brucella lupini]|uniref:Uncharacterized protein n=1 Tax=Brucella lupini TaxID=255457 RepID=A0A256H138_9HYPH|nr:hypothetical protein [Brucella lupini]KAB2699925.1 hypothetical protein F9L03_24970 [Brucella lupini]OYR32998.1 hypothetical protein CES86_5306 [Brucella lupini]
MSDNLDFHKSEQLHSLLIEGEDAVAMSADAPEHASWLDGIPIFQFAAIALVCGLGTVALISSVI